MGTLFEQETRLTFNVDKKMLKNLLKMLQKYLKNIK
jgi:hypothetical protein